MGQRNQRDSCPQLAGLTPLTLPARPLAEMPRLTSPSPQMPAEAACSEPTLLAPHLSHFLLFHSDLCLSRLPRSPGEVGKGGLTGRPKAFRGFSAPCTLTARPVLRGGAHPPRPEIQRSCTGWEISPRLRNEDSIPLSSQLCWFPLALPGYVATLSCYIDTKCLRVFLL